MERVAIGDPYHLTNQCFSEQHHAQKVRVRFVGGIADGQERSFGEKPLFIAVGDKRYDPSPTANGGALVYPKGPGGYGRSGRWARRLGTMPRGAFPQGSQGASPLLHP